MSPTDEYVVLKLLTFFTIWINRRHNKKNTFRDKDQNVAILDTIWKPSLNPRKFLEDRIRKGQLNSKLQIEINIIQSLQEFSQIHLCAEILISTTIHFHYYLIIKISIYSRIIIRLQGLLLWNFLLFDNLVMLSNQ